MAGTADPPDRATVAAVLQAAADVIFSDGVHPAVLAQWIDETCFLLSLAARSSASTTATASAGAIASGPRRGAVYDPRLPPE